MHSLNLALLLLTGSVLILGLGSKALKRWGLPDSVLLFGLGVVCGPVGFGLLEPTTWPNHMAVLEQAARLALAVGVMGVALRLPGDFTRIYWRSTAMVLVLAMPFMWLVSSAVIGLSLDMTLATALLLGAIVTPTDPVVASAVVTGPVAQKTLPQHIRRIISAESGANDGLGFLFVMAAVYMLTLTSSTAVATGVLHVVLFDLIAAVIAGWLLGYAAGFLLCKAEANDLIEQPSILMFSTALALVTLTGVKLLGCDGVLAVFVAGLAFDRQVNVKERQQEGRVIEGVDRFFTSPIFLLLGLMMPWQEWLNLGWPAVALVAGVLLLRRLPLFLLLGGRLGDLPRRADGVFAGWFAPLGVAAVYYAALAHHETHVPELWPVVSLLVAASIVVHGLTATPFSHLYARWTARNAGA